jgi:hypothetical protein
VQPPPCLPFTLNPGKIVCFGRLVLVQSGFFASLCPAREDHPRPQKHGWALRNKTVTKRKEKKTIPNGRFLSKHTCFSPLLPAPLFWVFHSLFKKRNTPTRTTTATAAVFPYFKERESFFWWAN